MLTQTVEYALRAVAHLGQQAPAARTTDQIAAATRVPKAYLSKVLQALVRGGVVRSQRGAHGGMTLAKSPEELTILEVVNAVDPVRRIRSWRTSTRDTVEGSPSVSSANSGASSTSASSRW